MTKLKRVFCSFCGKEFFRERGRFNEAKKIGWNQYCSKKCLSKSRIKKQVVICENCGKSFMRKPSEISPHNYCSKSCAAKVNNKRYPKRQAKLKICANVACNKRFRGSSKYCSKQCKLRTLRTYSHKELIEIIKRTAQELKRVPAKRELKEITRACETFFGSWNKAIIAAGLRPNRSHNQRMYKCSNIKALDGHLCDSISEAIIDNWLTKNKIPHERNIKYPDTNHKADWGVNINGETIFVEYFGLANDSPRYDRTIRKKKMLCQKHNLTLIAIYPQDLYAQKYFDIRLRDKFRGLIGI